MTSRLSHLSYVEEESGHSLPSLEQARTQAAIDNNDDSSKNHGASKNTTNRRMLMLTSGTIVILALVVGFGVSILTNASKKQASYSDVKSGDLPKEDDFDSSYADELGFTTREISRLDKVQDFLKVKISGIQELQNRASPQYKAALWIADQDEAFLDIPNDPNSYDNSYHFVQRYIIAVFYFALDGPQWTDRIEFLSEKSVCGWHFALSANTAPQGADRANWKYGIQCDEYDAVTHIFITGNGLKGRLPEEIGDLLDLQHLSLFHNQITGGLPDHMRYLSQLEFLAIESNELSGPLPNWLNQLTSLTYLALGDNKITGQLPSFTNMTYLEQIALDYNMMNGPIDAINDAHKLEHVFLNNNEFDGRIDDETFLELENLRVLDMSYNQLKGYFPSHFYHLHVCDLHSNSINEKALPEIPFQNMPLRILSLWDNQLFGSIPATINLLTRLEHLDLSENKLTGDIVTTFADLESLVTLYLSRNDFTPGALPHVRQNTNLEELSLMQTQRTGGIHSWIPNSLTNLVLLDLHDNQLTGAIPPLLGSLEYLKILMLNRNQLSGEIPAELADLESIVTMFLDNNDLTGSLEPVCQAAPQDLAFFSSDSDVTCSCCTVRCNNGDDKCNNLDTLDRLNESAVRHQFMFSEDLIFHQTNPQGDSQNDSPNNAV